MLDLAAIDVDELAEALQDNSYESSWWFDPNTGKVEYCAMDDDADAFEERDLVYIDAIGSSEAYSDMADFVEGIQAARPRAMLGRAIEGRGAFRRFKDTLFEFPELREEWFSYHDLLMRRRAIDWLSSNGIVDAAAAATAVAALGELPRAVGRQDAASVAARALRDLYGDRLVDVVVFGSSARGDDDPDSDLDLMVVLRDPVEPWDELRSMDGVLWELTQELGLTVSALPVGEEQWRSGGAPVLVEARAHGSSVQ